VHDILNDVGVFGDSISMEKFHVSLPILDVRGEVLQYIIAFIYKGELNVPRNLLFEVVECAEVLEINILVDLIRKMYYLHENSATEHPAEMNSISQPSHYSGGHLLSEENRHRPAGHSDYVMRLLSNLAYHNAYKKYLTDINSPNASRQSRSQSFDLGMKNSPVNESEFLSRSQPLQALKVESSSEDRTNEVKAHLYNFERKQAQSTIDDSSIHLNLFKNGASEAQGGLRVKKDLMRSAYDEYCYERDTSSIKPSSTGSKIHPLIPTVICGNGSPPPLGHQPVINNETFTQLDTKPFMGVLGSDSLQRRSSFGHHQRALKSPVKSFRAESSLKPVKSEPLKSRPLKAKRYKQYPPGAVDRAIRMIMDGVPVHKAADECGVPPRTLYEKKSIVNGDKAKRQKKVKGTNVKQVGSYGSSGSQLSSMKIENGFDVSPDHRRFKSESPESRASPTGSFLETQRTQNFSPSNFHLTSVLPSASESRRSSCTTDNVVQSNGIATENGKSDSTEEMHVEQSIGESMERLFLSKSVSPVEKRIIQSEISDNADQDKHDSNFVDVETRGAALDLRDAEAPFKRSPY